MGLCAVYSPDYVNLLILRVMFVAPDRPVATSSRIEILEILESESLETKFTARIVWLCQGSQGRGGAVLHLYGMITR